MVVDTEMDPNEAAALFVTAQLARFIVCSVAVVLPCVLLIATLPMKTTSRWKLPLRVACACVSVLMLSFNISSWWVEFQAFENEEKPADLSWFGYIVIASSIGLLLLMAVLFIVFVVFRGAQLQKKIEDADEEEESIKDLVVQIRLYLVERREQRVFTAWRVVAVDMIADRARILQLAAEQAEADAITAEAARVEALERAAAVVVGELTLPDDDGRRLIEQQHDGGEGGDGGEEVRDVHALTGGHDVVPTALPDDWIPSLDIGTGEVTYLNPETDERLTEENALPDGWIASLDISTGEVVYLNLETDERLTEEPHELNGGWVLTSSLLDDAGSTAEGDDGGEVTKKPRKLYTNTITGKTSNKRPLPLQPGWSVTLDPDTGRPFYRHETDGTSSFAAPLILPGGWVKLCEEESGHPYYYNKVTGATSWGHPHELPASSSSNEELQEGMVFELDALPPLDVVEDVFDFDQVRCCFQGLATRSRPFLSHGCLTHPPSLPPSLSLAVRTSTTNSPDEWPKQFQLELRMSLFLFLLLVGLKQQQRGRRRRWRWRQYACNSEPYACRATCIARALDASEEVEKEKTESAMGMDTTNGPYVGGMLIQPHDRRHTERKWWHHFSRDSDPSPASARVVRQTLHDGRRLTRWRARHT